MHPWDAVCETPVESRGPARERRSEVGLSGPPGRRRRTPADADSQRARREGERSGSERPRSAAWSARAITPQRLERGPARGAVARQRHERGSRARNRVSAAVVGASEPPARSDCPTPKPSWGRERDRAMDDGSPSCVAGAAPHARLPRHLGRHARARHRRRGRHVQRRQHGHPEAAPVPRLRPARRHRRHAHRARTCPSASASAWSSTSTTRNTRSCSTASSSSAAARRRCAPRIASSASRWRCRRTTCTPRSACARSSGVCRVAEDADGVVLISDQLWSSWFGRDPAVIGKSYFISGGMRQVIGVMPPEFRFPSDDTMLWVAGEIRLDQVRPGQFGLPDRRAHEGRGDTRAARRPS